MTMHHRYLDAVERSLARARDRNQVSLVEAARVVADTIERDGIVRAFGTGHSQLMAMELGDRAGGLAPVDVIVDPTNGRAENVEGFASTLLHADQIRAPDCLLVVSTSGRNAAPIEMALIARDRGVRVIALTSVAFSLAVSSRHSSGNRLLDVADVVLDLCADVGDAVVHVEGVPVPVGPISTVIGAALLNGVVVEAASELVRRGIEAPVFASQNVDGTDDHNAALEARYRARIRGLR